MPMVPCAGLSRPRPPRPPARLAPTHGRTRQAASRVVTRKGRVARGFNRPRATRHPARASCAPHVSPYDWSACAGGDNTAHACAPRDSSVYFRPTAARIGVASLHRSATSPTKITRKTMGMPRFAMSLRTSVREGRDDEVGDHPDRRRRAYGRDDQAHEQPDSANRGHYPGQVPVPARIVERLARLGQGGWRHREQAVGGVGAERAQERFQHERDDV